MVNLDTVLSKLLTTRIFHALYNDHCKISVRITRLSNSLPLGYLRHLADRQVCDTILGGFYKNWRIITRCSGGSRGRRPRRIPPPLAAKLFSISGSCPGHLIKFYLAPPSPRLGAPPCENPGSATEMSWVTFGLCNLPLIK